MKHLMLICDGMDDLPSPELDNKTPFEAADTPNMDMLAKEGRTGTVKNCPDSLAAGSDTGIMTLLGADPERYYTGRAPLEAADMGISVPMGSMAVRANFISLTDEEYLFARRIVSHAGVDGDEAFEAAMALVDDVKFNSLLSESGCCFYPRRSFQQMAVLPERKAKLIPPHEHLGEPVGKLLPDDEILRALTIRSMEVLYRKNLALWFWGEGTAPSLPAFPVPAAMISATPVCRGIAKLMGMDTPVIQGATGTIDTDYEAKADAAIEALKKYDFVTVHIEAPDQCSHLRNAKLKAEAIHRIDSRLLPPLLAYLEENKEEYRILIVSDHRTLCETGIHTGDPVPYIEYSNIGTYKDIRIISWDDEI